MKCGYAVCDPLGVLMPGPRPLEGKSFYLDKVKSQACGILTKLITRLGGKVESFLYKDVKVVITGNKDTLTDITASSGKVTGHHSPSEQRESSNYSTQRAATLRVPVCGSRGKALLEKVMLNNEQTQGGVLSTAARDWGVKIVSVHQFMKMIEELRSQSSTHTHCRREEKKSSDCSRVHVIKAGRLKTDFVKVEDSSRKYRPLHGQCLDFPILRYTSRFSPFEHPSSVQSGKPKDDDLSEEKFRRSKEPVSTDGKPSAMPSPKISLKKKSMGYCECCQIKYNVQNEHLQSDVHRRFAEDVNNYSVVDQLVVAMESVFSGNKDLQVDAVLMGLSSSSVAPPCELELQCKNETETCQENSEAEPVSKNMEFQQEYICDAGVLLLETQEPCVDTLCATSLEPMFVNKKFNLINDETCVPSPYLQDDLVMTNKLQECASASSGEESDDHQQEHAEICPRTLPSLETSLKESRGSSSPKKNQDDTANDSTSAAETLRREPKPVHNASSCSPAFHSLTLPSVTKKGANPKKRSKSFTLRLKASKIRRTCQWPDPTNQKSRVNVKFHHIPHHEDITVHKPDTVEQDLFPNNSLTNIATPEDCLSLRNDLQNELVSELHPNSEAHDEFSELGPPKLYPFFHDDIYQNQLLFLDPPKLIPGVPFPVSQSCGASLLSSIGIEPALVPQTFSSASSESDWDSGLMSRLAPPAHLQPREGHCELDLGLLLQGSSTGMQDGSYALQLCSVLQPSTTLSHTSFGDLNTMYQTIETMDRLIIQSLGV